MKDSLPKEYSVEDIDTFIDKKNDKHQKELLY